MTLSCNMRGVSNQKSVQELFYEIPLKVKKQRNYFSMYEEILGPYRNKRVKVLEIGVLDGGSLALWKRYLGAKAKVIGVDVNPRAAEIKSRDFEILIGNQCSKKLWQELREVYGQFDLIIDDGGHTNRQQLLTLLYSIELIKDGGKLITEDVHCSYMKDFGNPSRYSFVNFAFGVVNKINSRFFEIPGSLISKAVYKVSFYESAVVFEINRKLCDKNREVSNFVSASARGDHRHKNDYILEFIDRDLKRAFSFITTHERVLGFARILKAVAIKYYLYAKLKVENVGLRKYFN